MARTRATRPACGLFTFGAAFFKSAGSDSQMKECFDSSTVTRCYFLGVNVIASFFLFVYTMFTPLRGNAPH